MEIGKLKLGKIDAKNEVLRDEDRKLFELSFMIPPDFPFHLFASREKFIVYGAKGSGKTALLRYLEIKEKQNGSDTHFILFRNEISTIPADLQASAGITVASIDAPLNSGDREYVVHWKLYLYAFIAQRLSVVYGIFTRDVELDNFLRIFRSKPDSILRVKKGSANLDISSNPKLALQIDFESGPADQESVRDLVARAESSLKRINRTGRGSICIYFDELELPVLDSSRRRRDAVLARDLIRACEQVNRLCTELRHPIYISLAVRSDVVNNASQGYEINKIVQDLGAHVSWSKPLSEQGLHPLHKLIARRLQAAASEDPNERNYEETWRKFFPAKINGVASRAHVLHQTWFKPRDVVRLLSTAAELSPDAPSFSQAVLSDCRKEYATRCWQELCEELSTKYNAAAISGVKQLFTGEASTFTLTQLQDIIRRKRPLYPEIDALLAGTVSSAQQILVDLYRIGFIGNQSQTNGHQRWSFRGDEETVFDSQFVVHRAIHPLLSIDFSPR